jgi:hypothetical protein
MAQYGSLLLAEDPEFKLYPEAIDRLIEALAVAGVISDMTPDGDSGYIRTWHPGPNAAQYYEFPDAITLFADDQKSPVFYEGEESKTVVEVYFFIRSWSGFGPNAEMIDLVSNAIGVKIVAHPTRL